MTKKNTEKTYSKEQFLQSKNYDKTMVAALLEDGKTYSHNEVKDIIDKFLKRKVVK